MSNSLASRTKWCDMSVGWVANISVCRKIDECQINSDAFYYAVPADSTYERIAVASKQRRRIEQQTIDYSQPGFAANWRQPQSIRCGWSCCTTRRLSTEMLHQIEQNRVAIVECEIVVLQCRNSVLRRDLPHPRSFVSKLPRPKTSFAGGSKCLTDMYSGANCSLLNRSTCIRFTVSLPPSSSISISTLRTGGLRSSTYKFSFMAVGERLSEWVVYVATSVCEVMSVSVWGCYEQMRVVRLCGLGLAGTKCV